MNDKAAEIFSCLEGRWVLYRDIPGQGRIQGHVMFTRMTDKRIRYHEKGLFYMDSGAILEVERSYIYELRDGLVLIYYDDPERRNEVMHELSFTPEGVSHHTHICGSDRYALDFLMRSAQEIEMEYRVCGDKKDYAMMSRLTKAV